MSRLPSPLRRKYCGCKYGLKELKLLETEEPRIISPVRKSLSPSYSPSKYTHLNQYSELDDDQYLPSWWSDTVRKVPTSPRRLYLE